MSDLLNIIESKYKLNPLICFFFNMCLDIDECAIKTDNCSINAVCNNSEGSFNCSCKPGFSGDGIKCTGNYTLLRSISSTRLDILSDSFDNELILEHHL